jgi:8-oxo-dGTP diphosphatase
MKVGVDIVIFTIQAGALKVLLVKRRIPPFKDQPAILGGLVLPDEDLDQAVLRELREETGVTDVYLEQLYYFSDPQRDPRGRIISIAYFALISSDHQLKAGTDVAEASWWPVDQVPSLAFDHARILAYAVERLRNKLEYTTVGFQLLPTKFTLGELRTI